MRRRIADLSAALRADRRRRVDQRRAVGQRDRVIERAAQRIARVVQVERPADRIGAAAQRVEDFDARDRGAGGIGQRRRQRVSHRIADRRLIDRRLRQLQVTGSQQHRRRIAALHLDRRIIERVARDRRPIRNWIGVTRLGCVLVCEPDFVASTQPIIRRRPRDRVERAVVDQRIRHREVPQRDLAGIADVQVVRDDVGVVHRAPTWIIDRRGIAVIVRPGARRLLDGNPWRLDIDRRLADADKRRTGFGIRRDRRAVDVWIAIVEAQHVFVRVRVDLVSVQRIRVIARDIRIIREAVIDPHRSTGHPGVGDHQPGDGDAADVGHPYRVFHWRPDRRPRVRRQLLDFDAFVADVNRGRRAVPYRVRAILRPDLDDVGELGAFVVRRHLHRDRAKQLLA